MAEYWNGVFLGLSCGFLAGFVVGFMRAKRSKP
jgi:hypothetical protein